jgi:hypothetical protein
LTNKKPKKTSYQDNMPNQTQPVMCYIIGRNCLPSDAFTSQGAPMKVETQDGTATITLFRLLDPSESFQRELVQVSHLPKLYYDGLLANRNIKWIRSPSGNKNGAKFIVYWVPTVVYNWQHTGLNAEFSWMPTFEPRENIPPHIMNDPCRWVEARVAWRDIYHFESDSD